MARSCFIKSHSLPATLYPTPPPASIVRLGKLAGRHVQRPLSLALQRRAFVALTSPVARERLASATSPVSSPQLCNISASPYLWDIGVNGLFHTRIPLIKARTFATINNSLHGMGPLT
eukprot:scaffold28927_cov149-Isochrysis_galbana.AAC.1